MSRVHHLEDGDIPAFPKPKSAPAFVYDEDGRDILAVVKPDRVVVPLFEVSLGFPVTEDRASEAKMAFDEFVGLIQRRVKYLRDIARNTTLDAAPKRPREGYEILLVVRTPPTAVRGGFPNQHGTVSASIGIMALRTGKEDTPLAVETAAELLHPKGLTIGDTNNTLLWMQEALTHTCGM